MGKPRIAPKFLRHLFSKDHRLIITNYGIIQQEQNAWQCYYDLKKYDKIENQEYVCSGLFDKRLHLQRINLKRPLSRGSHFKIYFRLKNRENRGSRQNFHRTPFSKDRVLIKSDHS